MTNAPHQDLRQNLDAFIRKYHRNEMLRGLLLLLAAFPVAWLTVLALEAFGQFGTDARTVLFYAFVATIAVVTIRYLAWPALRLFRLRGGLHNINRRERTHKTASAKCIFFQKISKSSKVMDETAR